MAWEEGRSSKHEIDIYGMMLAHYMRVLLNTKTPFDEGYVTAQAKRLGDDVFELPGLRSTRPPGKRSNATVLRLNRANPG